MTRQRESRIKLEPMTLEEQARGFAVLERLRILREELYEKRGRKLFRSAGEDLDELRAEAEDRLE